MNHRFTVQFAVPFRYEVLFTRGVFQPDNHTLFEAITCCEPERRHRMLVVVDSGVSQAWPQLTPQIHHYVQRHSASLTLAGEPIVVRGGEASKNDPRHVSELHAEMAQRGLDRQSFCVVVGGGAVQDMAGFAAATAHRGVRVVRLPTTVLAQNDSGVGVKNGINGFGMKNFVGSFAPPHAVINDTDFLETLERRDRLAGIAEAVKVSLIRDAAFFDWLCQNANELQRLEPAATHSMIQRSAELHLRHIETSGDPFEFGSARPLDFGHWAAHKLESMSQHSLRHGEAVAIGLALDTRYCVEAGLLDAVSAGRVLSLLTKLGLPTFAPQLDELDADGSPKVLAGLREFQEHLGGQLTVTLLKGLGVPFDCHDMDSGLITRAIRWLGQSPTAECATALASRAVE